MLFDSYTVSGLRYFLILAIPVLAFAILYFAGRIKHGRKIEDFRSFTIASRVIMAYVLIFFLYLFLFLGRG